MEITESTIYWITRLDGIRTAAGICLGVGIIVIVICSIFWGVQVNELMDTFSKERREHLESILKLAIKTACCSAFAVVICISILLFVPSTKEMTMIKILPAISNSKFVSEELPKDVREIYVMAKEAVKEKLVGEKK